MGRRGGRAWGEELEFLDRDAVQAEVHSPLWQAGALLGRPAATSSSIRPSSSAGWPACARSAGSRSTSETRVRGVERRAGRVRSRRPTTRPSIADHVVVATSAYSGWLRRLSSQFVPVYDYVLVSDPLTPEQRDVDRLAAPPGDVRREQPVPLLPADRRRPDPVGRLRRDLLPEQRRRTGVRPAAGDVRQARRPVPARVPAARATSRFPYRWGGAIDTTSRFTVTFGQALGGRLTYALGYTGLGVGASRWAGGVVRDFILRPDSDLLRLRFVRSRPFPFPPEPLRSLAVNAVRHELDRADRNEGRRGVLLRTLDALGIGFDS